MTVQVENTPVGAENSFYRRGLILGLTLAEISLLIVFVLLLVFGGLLRKAQSSLERQAALQREAAAARQQLRRVLGDYAPKASGQQINQWVNELIASSVSQAENRELKDQLKAASSALDRISKATESTGLSKPQPNPTANPADRWKQIASDVEAAAAQVRAGQVVTRELASGQKGEVAKAAVDVQLEDQQLRGALANAQRKLEAAGKGTERPACWATADGRPEYIFNITLSAGGMRVHDRALPNRRAQEAILPIRTIRFDQVVSPEVFRQQTRTLFDWGEARGCRFFVVAVDGTGASEKEIFKQRLRVMEEHFYKFLSN